MTAGPRREYHGSPGADGQTYGLVHRVDRARTGAAGVDIGAAFRAVAKDLDTLAAGLRDSGAFERADIAEATGLIAADPNLRAAAESALASGLSPTAAVTEAAEGYARLLAELPDATLAARAADVRAVGRRLVAALSDDLPGPPVGPVVLVGAEVAADDLLRCDHVAGVVSVLGGGTSHTGIVARSMDVPAVFGIDPSLLGFADGTPIVVNGGRGTAVVHPGPFEVRVALDASEATRRRRATAVAARGEPVVTRDGHPVTVLANIATLADAKAAVAAGAAGIGLVRTELPFLSATAWPSREQHLAALTPLLAPLEGQVVTVRVLDFAADKLPPFLAGADEGGLALLLSAPEALQAQLRAVLRAGAGTRLRVMVPMVATVDQFRFCQDLLLRAAAVEGTSVPPLGAMMELPEAVAEADEIARHADFLSIGSNDLTASLLSRTRRDPALLPISAAEPVVLQAIAHIVSVAARQLRPVSICGDAAAVTELIPLLLGLGDGDLALSVAPAALDEVRLVVRRLTLADCRDAAGKALTATALDQVRAIGASLSVPAGT